MKIQCRICGKLMDAPIGWFTVKLLSIKSSEINWKIPARLRCEKCNREIEEFLRCPPFGSCGI